MPIERQRWNPAPTLERANADLRRVVEVLDQCDRVDVQRYDVTATIAPTYPVTVVESDTTAGAVALAFPDPRTVPGFRVDVVQIGGANALTANSVTVAAFAGWISTGAAWRRVA